jgi:hypothetical protein
MHAPKNGMFYVLDAKTGKFAVRRILFVPAVNWLLGLRQGPGRPILNPDANYGKTGKGWYLLGFQSHVWNPMSYQPGHGTDVHPDQLPQLRLCRRGGREDGQSDALHQHHQEAPRVPMPKMVDGPGSYLQAWDPVKKKTAWIQPEGYGPRPAP